MTVIAVFIIKEVVEEEPEEVLSDPSGVLFDLMHIPRSLREILHYSFQSPDFRQVKGHRDLICGFLQVGQNRLGADDCSICRLDKLLRWMHDLP
jgi:hypothetical protein